MAYSPVAPLTTVRYLSTRAVDGTWTSLASPEMATNTAAAVTAYAGNGHRGPSPVTAGAATAGHPQRPGAVLRVAPDGRVFIADSGNNRIRVVATNGTISTFAGGTGGARARAPSPARWPRCG